VALDGSPFQRGTASCTGSEYCKLAITETKLFSIRLAQELEERLPGFTDTVKLHVAGARIRAASIRSPTSGSRACCSIRAARR
jgi:hypothetical protein